MEILAYPFFRNALIGVVLVAVVAALAGTYVVSRRQVFISGGITHACFGGLGLGYWLGVSPMLMAAVFAVAGALGVDRLASARVRRDSAIAVVWGLGMALGVLFIFLTPGYVPELNTFLFGNVLTVTSRDLILFSVFTLVLGIFYAIFHRLIVTVSFDSDFAKTLHLPVRFIELSMTVFTAIAIVLTIRMIGIMLLISVFSLPQMTAEVFSHKYRRVMSLSFLFCLTGGVGGLVLAYIISVPASAAIVILLTLFYCIAAAWRHFKSSKGNASRRGCSSSVEKP